MVTVEIAEQRRLGRFPASLLEAGMGNQAVLKSAIALHLICIPLLVAALIFDPKLIDGVNGWIKPIKFAISGAVYGGTFWWLTSHLRGRQGIVAVASAVTGIALIVETALITLQVIRGTTSHFNLSTDFDATIFSLMGNFIVLVSLMNLALAVLLIVQRADDRDGGDGRVLMWSLRLGVLCSFLFGMGGGYLMVAGPTPEQVELVRETGELPYVGAHAVGVPDGGPGLPVVNWSTEAGDLRVGHFVGLHGMQLIPLLGLALSTRAARRRWSAQRRLSLLLSWGAGYMLVAALLIWQALRGQSIVAPDAMTWIAAGTLVVAVSVATVIAIGQPLAE